MCRRGSPGMPEQVPGNPPFFAPQGAKACSQGGKPQGEGPQMNPQAPKGRQIIAPSEVAVAPSGLWVRVGAGDLGLTPQATCLCPLRGKIPEARLVARFAALLLA